MTPFNKYLLHILPLCFLFCFQLNSIASNADIFYTSDTLDQSRKITGTITDAEGGHRLSTVVISVKFTDIATSTDVAGNFVLEAPRGAITLVFDHPGYETKEMDVEFESNLILFLERPVDFVPTVSVGYGTVKESDLTGSITTINEDELTAYPSINLIQAMQARAAGLNIMANNGEPGADYKVRIRGATSINASSDPIYVVDGYVQATLPPAEDIASIEILKDASAASIYGSRGANGVILITTKTGEPGSAKINFNTSYSFQKVTRKLDLLNAEEFITYQQELDPSYVPGTANTDWQEEIFRTGGIQNSQLSLSGGTENINYYLSATYWDQKGTVLGSQYNRFFILNNINVKASQRLNIGFNIFAQRIQRDGVHTQELDGGVPGVTSAALKFGTDSGIYDENGIYTLQFSNQLDNAFAIATERLDERVDDRIRAYFYAEYKLSDALNFKSTFGAGTGNLRNGLFVPSTLTLGKSLGGLAAIVGAKNSILLNENYLTFSKKMNSNDLSVMVGYSLQKFRNETWFTGGSSFTSDTGTFWNLGSASSFQQPNSGLSEAVLASMYSRFNYSFAGKYIATFNARGDGSSSFSKNNKWAFFPSAALAWNIHEEGFMKDVGWLNRLKARVSYGVTGNQAISPYQTLASLATVFTVIDGVPVNAVAPSIIPNNSLTWETTLQSNVGIDLDLFENRFGITLDYYRMKTFDLLLEVPPVQFSGYGSQLINSGEIENKGLELSIRSNILENSLKWSADFIISGNRNVVLSLPDTIFSDSHPRHMTGINETQILRVGESIGVFYGWEYEGVIQEDMSPNEGFDHERGGEKFRDLNGDGVLDNLDRKIIGNPNPDFIWSFNNNFQYKNFDFNIFFQGTQGNDILSYTLLELDILNGGANATTLALDRSTTANITEIPKASLGRSQRVSSRWVFDGSYIRLKNISLGYSIPESKLGKWKIEKFRFYVSAQNILTITKYKGYDPEVNYNSNGSARSNQNLGLDYGSYPMAKSITIGLNVGF